MNIKSGTELNIQILMDKNKGVNACDYEVG